MSELIEHTQTPLRLYTIGHSNVLASTLIGLLKMYEVEVLVDVRSSPYSQYNPQFNRESFEIVLNTAGIDYFYLGDKLGGRPMDPTCYKNKHIAEPKADYLHLVDYPVVMEKDFFLEGINQLIHRASIKTTAVMCSEENPAKCHRHHLIGRYLMDQGIEVFHIRGDGNAVNGKQFSGLAEEPLGEQAELF
jgi:uncharacterized protein (DUF488 family)